MPYFGVSCLEPHHYCTHLPCLCQIRKILLPDLVKKSNSLLTINSMLVVFFFFSFLVAKQKFPQALNANEVPRNADRTMHSENSLYLTSGQTFLKEYFTIPYAYEIRRRKFSERTWTLVPASCSHTSLTSFLFSLHSLECCLSSYLKSAFPNSHYQTLL